MLGIIANIEVVTDFGIAPVAPLEGRGGRLGLSQMLGALMGHSSMDGYKVTTSEHTFYVLIDNAQSCCESWGYMSSEDDHVPFIGATLREINLTDTALNTERLKDEEALEYGVEDGGIQFVDFVTDRGTFQLAVYNSHNGYYGHGILVARDDNIILNDSI